jgi:hypothetical protein
MLDTLPNKDLAVLVGFLFAACLAFGLIAWCALNFIESDIDRFHDWAAGKETF